MVRRSNRARARFMLNQHLCPDRSRRERSGARVRVVAGARKLARLFEARAELCISRSCASCSPVAGTGLPQTLHTRCLTSLEDPAMPINRRISSSIVPLRDARPREPGSDGILPVGGPQAGSLSFDAELPPPLVALRPVAASRRSCMRTIFWALLAPSRLRAVPRCRPRWVALLAFASTRDTRSPGRAGSQSQRAHRLLFALWGGPSCRHRTPKVRFRLASPLFSRRGPGLRRRHQRPGLFSAQRSCGRGSVLRRLSKLLPTCGRRDVSPGRSRLGYGVAGRGSTSSAGRPGAFFTNLPAPRVLLFDSSRPHPVEVECYEVLLPYPRLFWRSPCWLFVFVGSFGVLRRAHGSVLRGRRSVLGLRPPLRFGHPC